MSDFDVETFELEDDAFQGVPPGESPNRTPMFFVWSIFFRLGPEFVVSQFLVNEFSKAQRDGSGFGG